ncbi:MAG: leucine-rich repeat domain-containing protein [Bacteroidales bacterium]|nr:leucine-rich repeat domain-containing protein [Bacteroidales bacterium]
MKKVINIILLVLLTSPAFAQADQKADFSAVCSTGQVLHYKIIDYGEVNVWYNNQNPELLGGYIKVPRTVKYNDQNYVVTGVADEAFANCIRIQGVELPTTMFFVGERAFYRCTDLRVILMPKTLTYIGSSAFEGCTSLIDVVMPNSVNEMGTYVFKDCDNVRHFVISHGLTEIPEGTFMNCKSATDFLIPASVISIGCHAFDGYEQLKSVTFFGPVPPEPECVPAFGREIPIYVINQYFPAYKASYIWGQYAIQSM